MVSTCRQDSLQAAEQFVNFMMSPRIQKLLLKYGFDAMPSSHNRVTALPFLFSPEWQQTLLFLVEVRGGGRSDLGYLPQRLWIGRAKVLLADIVES